MRPARALLFFCLLAGCSHRATAVIKPGADFSKIDRIAVLGFDNYPRQKGSGSRASGFFEKRLLLAGYTVVERRRVDELLKEQRLSVSGAVDPKLARKIGVLLGVDALLLGSVTEFQKPATEHFTTPVENVRKEPVIRRVKKTKKVDDQTIEYEEDEISGYNTTRTTSEESRTRYIDAIVGVSARLVDVTSGEVLWIGSDPEPARAVDEAAEDAAEIILDAVKSTWPINRGKKK